MQHIRSFLYALIFYPATILYVIVGLTLGLFAERPMQAVVHGWAHLHHWLAEHLLRVRLKIDGEIPEGPYLIAMKHQSMYETIQTLRVLQTPVVVLKRELA